MLAFNRRHVVFAAAAIIGMSALPARATPIPTDTILFQDLGPTIVQFFDGSPFGTCLVEDAGCTTTSEQGGGTGIPSFNLTTSGFPVNFNIYDDAGFTKLSDTFSLSVQDFSGVGGTANTVVATFTSLAGTPLTPLSGGTVINMLETGVIQDLGTVTFVNDAGAPVAAIDYQFISDEPPIGVPEPSSLLLLGGALFAMAGLGAARRNHHARLARSVA
jgi:hypothetical protein